MSGNRESKGPTKNQLRGLSYVAPKTPSFLNKLKNQMAGIPDSASSGVDEFGRERIPQRPGADGSDEDDDEAEKARRWGEGGDDAPQIVVLKEGKHLSMEEVERIKRGDKEISQDLTHKLASPSSASTMKPSTTTKSQSSSTSSKPVLHSKRKAVAVGGDAPSSSAGGEKKKVKKEKKGLLSFDEEG